TRVTPGKSLPGIRFWSDFSFPVISLFVPGSLFPNILKLRSWSDAHVRVVPLHSQQTVLKPVSRSLSVTFAELCTRMSVREERQKELTGNFNNRRDSNGSHHQGEFRIRSAGRRIFAPANTACTRQHEARQHETRQDAGRGHGEDAIHGEVPRESTRHLGPRDGLSRGRWEAGVAAYEFQDFERSGCARDPGGDE